MDTSDTSADAAATLESTLASWESSLARLEQQAALVLRAAKQLRKAAQDGAVAGAPRAQEALRDGVAQLTEAMARHAETPPLDIQAAFESGSYLAELAEASANAGVTLVQRDGRVT